MTWTRVFVACSGFAVVTALAAVLAEQPSEPRQTTAAQSVAKADAPPAPADLDPAIPAGFATRVAARAAADGSVAGPWAMLERLALRGLVAAAACCVAAVAFNYFSSTPELPDEAELDETMSVMLDIS